MSGTERRAARRSWPERSRSFVPLPASPDPAGWVLTPGGAHSAVVTGRRWVGSVQRLAGNHAVADVLGRAARVQRDPVPGAEPAPATAAAPASPGPTGDAPVGSSREPTAQERDKWGAWFPDMDFRIVRPAESGYNCYAWAVGLTDRIISADTLMQSNYQATVEGWTKYLSDHHRFIPTKDGLDPGADLILYGDLPTMIYHAARKADVPFGRLTFSSKLGDGESPVILHDPADIQGRAYGMAQRSFKRG